MKKKKTNPSMMIWGTGRKESCDGLLVGHYKSLNYPLIIVQTDARIRSWPHFQRLFLNNAQIFFFYFQNFHNLIKSLRLSLFENTIADRSTKFLSDSRLLAQVKREQQRKIKLWRRKKFTFKCHLKVDKSLQKCFIKFVRKICGNLALNKMSLNKERFITNKQTNY